MKNKKSTRIEILVRGEIYMICFSEFSAMNNFHTLREKYGIENVKTRRVGESEV